MFNYFHFYSIFILLKLFGILEHPFELDKVEKQSYIDFIQKMSK